MQDGPQGLHVRCQCFQDICGGRAAVDRDDATGMACGRRDHAPEYPTLVYVASAMARTAIQADFPDECYAGEQPEQLIDLAAV